MAIIKCKMCGGDLVLMENQTVTECECCGSRQTVPSADNEKKLTMFARANRLRMACEFDKAAGIYEAIMAEFPEEAEAYWGMVLCKYGIEYVDDPTTGKKIPTCHRSSFDSIMQAPDFEQALENADAVARKVYREEAKQIEELRKRIIQISEKEKPYDIFICYKETDENEERTIDSVLAQDVYDTLVAKGYRVFFSRITLEDKLGQECEPYIFAALNSAKIMLAFGTDYEYFQEVWVKNEWSRFLKLMEKDKSRHLIPCYKDIDAYDMPLEFARLQALDLGKFGATQDLLRCIENLLPRQSNNHVGVQKQDCQVLHEHARKRKANLKWSAIAVGIFIAIFLVVTKIVVPANTYHKAESLLNNGRFDEAISMFEKLDNYKDSPARIAECEAKIDANRQAELDDKYNTAVSMMNEGKYTDAIMAFSKLNGYKDSTGLIEECTRTVKELQLKSRYDTAESLAKNGNLTQAAFAFGKLGDYRDSQTRSRELWPTAGLWSSISTYDWHTVGLKGDGTVVAAGDNYDGQCSVSEWSDIVAVSAGSFHTVGLRADGTVVATEYTGDYYQGQCDVSQWTNIVAVSAGNLHTVGLKSDGTVVAVGDNREGQCNVSLWSNIVAVSAGSYHTVGLKSDGTVVATEYRGKHYRNQCDVSQWRDIIAVSAGSNHTVGLKADGTVVAVGYNSSGQCNVEQWTDIVAVSAGHLHTIGLKADGTVVGVGDEDDYNYGECDVSQWRDIVEISAGLARSVGLKADGTVIAIGKNENNQCNVGDWTDIRVPKRTAQVYPMKQPATQSPVTSNEDLPAVTEVPVTTEKPEAPDAPKIESMTQAQKNALGTARNYLNSTAFSYEGLIHQLEYEQYAHEDAVFAADNCGADWSEQALKSAKNYLSFSAFSYKGLISQLEYEKYTTEQATYAADNCGADWNEQAAKSAANYLSFSSFSRDGLIGQLKYEGFTSEQAKYGVEANGY